MTNKKLSNKEIETTFLSLGFKKHMINGESIYENEEVFYRLTYINSSYGYVIETAENKEEAKKNRFEDSDIIPLKGTKEETLRTISECLKTYYL